MLRFAFFAILAACTNGQSADIKTPGDSTSDTPTTTLTYTDTADTGDITTPTPVDCTDWQDQCGMSIEPILREDWFPDFSTRNEGILLPSGLPLDVTDREAIKEAIFYGEIFDMYPPQPIWPQTDDFPDAYDVGYELCLEYGICWGWNTLDWLAQSHTPDTLVVHYTAGEIWSDCDTYLQYVADLHTFTNGWGDVGYNLLVCEDNAGVHVYEGRWSGDSDPGRDPWLTLWSAGAHSFPNTGTVGVALVMGPGRDPTATEFETYLQVMGRIGILTGLGGYTVVGHLDRNATLCPGRLYDLIPDIQERVDMCGFCATQTN